jgi:hypothetical protein
VTAIPMAAPPLASCRCFGVEFRILVIHPSAG